MRILILKSLVVAAALGAVSAHAGDGATLSRDHAAHRHVAFAKATALYANAPRRFEPPVGSVSDRPHEPEALGGDAGFSWEPDSR